MVPPEARFAHIPDNIINILYGITCVAPGAIEMIMIMIAGSTVIAICDVFICCGYIIAGFKFVSEYPLRSVSYVETLQPKNPQEGVFSLFQSKSVREHLFSAVHLLFSTSCWYIVNAIAGLIWIEHESIATIVFAIIACTMYFIGLFAGMIYARCQNNTDVESKKTLLPQ